MIVRWPAIVRAWRRRVYLALARAVCRQQWHAIEFAPHRWPWDRSALGGLRMYCARCGETLGYIP